MATSVKSRTLTAGCADVPKSIKNWRKEEEPVNWLEAGGEEGSDQETGF